jgi:hypothetical protein
MNNIIKTIESFKRKRFTGSISTDLIHNAENELGLNLSKEYKDVLQKYGSLCIKGEEFLGIDNDNYDIVKATKDARINDSNFPLDAYVIENTAIEGILIIQKDTCELFTYQPNGQLQPLSDTLEEYLLSL